MKSFITHFINHFVKLLFWSQQAYVCYILKNQSFKHGQVIIVIMGHQYKYGLLINGNMLQYLFRFAYEYLAGTYKTFRLCMCTSSVNYSYILSLIHI